MVTTLPTKTIPEEEDPLAFPRVTIPPAPQPSPVEVPPGFFDGEPEPDPKDNLPPGAVLDPPGPKDNLPPGAVLDAEPQRVPARFDPNPPPVNIPAGFEPTPEESFLHSTSVGRVLDSVGEGLNDGYGAGDLGLSPESEKALREAGFFRGDDENVLTGSLRAFNEALIRPAAASLELAVRSIGAVIHGGAFGIGQIAEEFGAERLTKRHIRKNIIGAATDPNLLMLFPPAAVVRVGAKQRVSGKPVTETRPPVREAIEREAVHTPFPDPAAAKVDPLATGTTGRVAAGEVEVTIAQELDQAGNINLNRIHAGEDIKQVIRDTAEVGEGFPGTTRGVISFEETQLLADMLGMTEKQLLARGVGQAFNAEEITAGRRLLFDSAVNVHELSRIAAFGTEADKVSFLAATMRHAAIQAEVSGFTAEAGRASNAFKIMIGEIKNAEAISKIIAENQGVDAVAAMAEKIAKLNDPAAVSGTLARMNRATGAEMGLEVWINGLLSGPQTHVANITGNSIVVAMSVPETLVAAAVGKSRSLFKGQAHTERVLAGEAVGRLQGIYQGASDGVVAGWRGFKSEVAIDGAHKIDIKRPQAIPSKTFREGVEKKKIFGVPIPFTGEVRLGGKQVRIPGRALLAMDEFYKSIGFRQEINAQAFRRADAEGLVGKARVERTAELVAAPTEEMRIAASAHARSVTFQAPLGKTGTFILSLSNAHPVMKIPLTFVRTPINILKHAGRRIPGFGSLISKEDRATLLGKNGAAARDEALARQAMGGFVMLSALALAENGLITGSGPSNPAENAAKQLTGWKPYSFKIGEEYYAYGRAGEPFSLLISGIVDAHGISKRIGDEDADEFEEVMTMLAVSISDNLTDKTWLRSPAAMVEALTQPERYGPAYIRQLAGSVVPSALATVARIQDPVLREARTVLDAMRARVPFVSEELFPKRDIFGRELVREGSLGPDFLSPIFISRTRDDPVAIELNTLGLFPGKMKREIFDVELTDAEYERLTTLAGKHVYQMLSQYVNAPGWKGIPEFARFNVLDRAIKAGREQAKKEMTLDPVFHEKVMDARRKKQKDMLDDIEKAGRAEEEEEEEEEIGEFSGEKDAPIPSEEAGEFFGQSPEEDPAFGFKPGVETPAGKRDDDKIKEVIKKKEKSKLKRYPDAGGFAIGVGFNLRRDDADKLLREIGADPKKVKAGKQDLTQVQSDKLFDITYPMAVKDARALMPDLDTFTQNQQTALIDMSFNLGKTRLSGFDRMIKAVNKGDWKKAAKEMLNSDYAKEDVPDRAKRNAKWLEK